MDELVKYIINGKLWTYMIDADDDGGGVGIVIADNEQQAIAKVKEAYKKHSGNDEISDFSVYSHKIEQCPFSDAPDVLEIFD